MSINKCDRCGRELVKADQQYGWRCAKIVGLPNGAKSYEQKYIEKLLKEAEKIESKISQATQDFAKELKKELKAAYGTFVSEIQKGVTEAGRKALETILSISIGVETPVNAITSDRNFEKNISLSPAELIL